LKFCCSYIAAFLFGIIIFTSSCTREEDFSTDQSLKLSFSTDTLFFDTVFSQFGTNTPVSVTKQLWVINRNKDGVKTNIRLSGQFPGVYILNIDGKPSSQATGKEIRGNDSIMIFVQIYVQPNGGNTPFIVNDQLIFETNGNIQEVQLLGYGRDAHYYRNEVLQGSGGQLVWENDKPYVIYDSVLVPRGLTLIIKQGTKIHSYNKSVLLVAGTIIVEGEANNPVTFEGTRTDADYQTLTGQWIGIRILPGSVDNIIKYAIIKNGIIGVEVDSVSANSNPNLLIRETFIENMQAAGLIGYSATITAINNIITNCGQFTFYGALGGDYTLYHNTFANYNTNFNRQNPHFLLDNSPFKDENGQIILSVPLNYRIANNIIYGSREEELILNNASDGNPTFTNRIFQNCLLKTTIAALNINNNILNKDPAFENSNDYDFRLKSESPAKNTGVYLNIPSDYGQFPRNSTTPSMGAWE
jgi:hypothetical protein